MIYVDDFPEQVSIHDHVIIRMSDGTELSARIWMPACAHETPVPAILEYIPYRKRFGSATRDELTHGYLAGQGYVCVRVDIRGSGEKVLNVLDRILEFTRLSSHAGGEVDDTADIVGKVGEIGGQQ